MFSRSFSFFFFSFLFFPSLSCRGPFSNYPSEGITRRRQQDGGEGGGQGTKNEPPRGKKRSAAGQKIIVENLNFRSNWVKK